MYTFVQTLLCSNATRQDFLLHELEKGNNIGAAMSPSEAGMERTC